MILMAWEGFRTLPPHQGTGRFQIHPVELARCRALLKPLAGELAQASRETVSSCPVCRSGCRTVLVDRDRYGLPVRTAMCLDCGLIYLVDRLTPEGYGKLYSSGFWRKLNGPFGGAATGPGDAARLARALAGYVALDPDHTLLEIGGGADGEWGRALGCATTAFDIEARGGVAALDTFFPGRRFDLILCRAIERLPDLGRALARVRCLLAPDGLLYCDVADFLETCRRQGSPQAVARVDHYSWFCQETAPGIFAALGFEVVSVNVTGEPAAIGYLLRPSGALALPEAAPALDPLIRRLREIDGDWRASACFPADARDRLHRTAYRIKRAVYRTLGRLRRHTPASGSPAGMPAGLPAPVAPEPHARAMAAGVTLSDTSPPPSRRA